jgi:hypothetical protein
MDDKDVSPDNTHLRSTSIARKNPQAKDNVSDADQLHTAQSNVSSVTDATDGITPHGHAHGMRDVEHSKLHQTPPTQ